MNETITLTLDGDQWCALLGPDLAIGIAGFGPTRAEAIAHLAIALAEHERTSIGHLPGANS